MSNANVNIKLSADTSQVRSEIKLIDQELSHIGNGTTPNNSGQGRSADYGRQDNSRSSKNDNATGLGEGEKRDTRTTQQRNEQAERTRLYQEITLIRKELQKLNRDGGFGNYGQASQTTTQSTTSGSSNSAPTPLTPSTPSSGSGGSGGSGTGSGGSGSNQSMANSIGSAVGKALTAGLVMAGLNRAKTYLSQGYQKEVSAEHQAYDTYGSTLNYTDYKEAKEQARDMGLNYGYDYSEVMSANKTYMQSGAGWTDAGSNMVNMTDILGTAHATGVDTSSLANAAGSGEAMGIDTNAFMTMFTNSIEKAGMTGREEEQLDVLNTIADLLHDTNVTVSEQKVADSLAVYNALIEGNENLKGQAGSAMWTDLNSAVTSGNTQMLRALGYGTDLEPGMEGYMEALRRASEGATTENLNRVMDYYVNQVGVTDKTQLEYLVGNAFGGLSAQNIQEMDELMNNYFQYDESTGTWNKRENESEGLLSEEEHNAYVNERTTNYTESDLGTEEKYQLQKQDTQEEMGNIWGSNPIAMKLKELYSGMSSGQRTATTIIGGAGSLLGGSLLTNAVGKWVGNGLGKLFGGASGTASGAAEGGSWFSNILKGFGKGGSTTGEAGETAGSFGEALGNASKAVGNGSDLAKGFGEGWNSGIGGKLWNYGKGIGSKLVGGADETAEVLDAAGNVIGRTSAAVSDAGSIAAEVGSIGASSADEAGTALSVIGEAANYSDEAADVLGAVGNAANYTDDAARAAAGVSEAAGATSALGKAGNFLGKAALPIAIGAEVLSTGIDVSEAKKRGDDREAAQELGGGVGGVAGAVGGTILGGMAAGAATGAVAGSVAPGIGTAIGAVVGAVVGIGTGIAGGKLGEKAGEAIYDANNDGYEFSDEQLEQIHKYYEQVQAIYDKEEDYNGKTGSNAAQDYVKNVVTPYLNSIGVSTSHTDEYKVDVGKNDFIKDVEKGLYGESGEDWEPVETDIDTSSLPASDVTIGNGVKQLDNLDEIMAAANDSTYDTTQSIHGTADYYRSQGVTDPDQLGYTVGEVYGGVTSENTGILDDTLDDGYGNSVDDTAQYLKDQGFTERQARDFAQSNLNMSGDELEDFMNNYKTLEAGDIAPEVSAETRFGEDRPYEEYGDINQMGHVEGNTWSDAGIDNVVEEESSLSQSLANMSGTIDEEDSVLSDIATEETTQNIEETVGEIRDYLRDGSFGNDNTTQLADTLENDENEENKSLFSKLASKTGSFFGNLFGGSDGSHATGNDYIPYDNYMAELHKGEMVLTKDEADDYRSGGIFGGSRAGYNNGRLQLDVNVNGNIDGMTAENQAQIVAAVISQINSPNLMNMLSTSFQRVQNY